MDSPVNEFLYFPLYRRGIESRYGFPLAVYSLIHLNNKFIEGTRFADLLSENIGSLLRSDFYYIPESPGYKKGCRYSLPFQQCIGPFC